MKTNIPRKNSQGAELLRALFCNGDRIFTHEQAVKTAMTLNICKKDLNIVLHRLTKQNMIKRLRRGLYICIGVLGEVSTIHPFVISTFLDRSSMISHWSALSHHGLTEQIPITVTASTSQRTPVNHFEIENISYEYKIIQPKHFYGFTEEWIDPHFKIRITDKERTLIDLFIYSRMFGGFGEALGILENVIQEIDIEKLVAYAIKYEEKTLAKRLGWALEQFGVPENELYPLRSIPISNYCPLDPEKMNHGPCDGRWSIQNNLKSEYKKLKP